MSLIKMNRYARRASAAPVITMGLALIAHLLLAGCSEPATPTVSLDRAVAIGDLDQIKRHIHWKSDLNQPNAQGDPPLHVAARDGRVAIARELARRGASLTELNAEGQSPLYVALSHGRTQVAMMLIDQGAPFAPQSLLRDLVDAGLIDRDALVFLVRSGARLEQTGPEGDAALHRAIKQGHLESVRRLILAGADVNQPDGAGRLPLQIARESAPGRDARFIVSTLERSGARVEAVH